MRRKIFSTLFVILCCVTIMGLTMMVSPALATSSESPDITETPAEGSPEGTATPDSSEGSIPESTTESTVTPTADSSLTETPKETTSPAETETPEETTSPEGTETPGETDTPTSSQSPEATDGTMTPTSTIAPTPTATPVPTPTPTRAPTTPPKLGLLTPPALSAEISGTAPTGSQEPNASHEIGSALPDSTVVPTPTHQVEHVEQVEIDPGFRMSDFIGILCYIVYGLAGFILLLGIVRIAILLIFKKDILPSKKERQKAKEEKERQDAIKRQKMIETDVTPEEFNIHKDDWNWK